MDFLQLCQRCATECGVSGTPTTTVAQIGSLARIVNWVGDAWNEIQTEHDDWQWMRASSILGSGVSFVPAAAQFTTPLGTGSGTVGISVDSFGSWDMESFRNYVTAVGYTSEIFMENVPFDNWRDSYMLGAMRSVETRPFVIAAGPDQSLNVAPPPDGNYTITGDYWMAPSLMVADTDVPVGLPTRWHMLIVYRAMLKYGYYEAASDVIARAQAEWGIMFHQLEAARLPGMGFAGALA